MFSEQQSFLSFNLFDFIFHCLVTAAQGFGIGPMFFQLDFELFSTAFVILLANKCFFGQVILIILNRKDRLLLPFFSFLMFFFGITFQPLLESKGFGHLLFCLPFLPFMIGALGLGYLAWTSNKANIARAEAETAAALQPEGPAPQKSMGDMLDLDDIHLEFAPDLVPLVLDPATGLDARIGNMRTHVAKAYGLVLPEIRLTDDPGLHDGTYVIRIHGVERVRDRLMPNHILALTADAPAGALPSGKDVAEPVYGAPARWVPEDTQDEVATMGLATVAPAAKAGATVDESLVQLLVDEARPRGATVVTRPVSISMM